MVTQTGIAKIENDPQKKKELLADLDNLFQKHGVEVHPKFKDIVAQPSKGKLAEAASSFVITITA
jgi:hypothetical protein